MNQLKQHLAIRQTKNQQGRAPRLSSFRISGMFIAASEYQGNHYLGQTEMIARASHTATSNASKESWNGEIAFKTIGY